MAASSITAPLKRAEPLVRSVQSCFRNAVMYSADKATATSLSSSPQMVVVFTWIGAKEKYAHKFVNSWTRRGFNVLHITTPVMDLVRPKTGTEVTASRVIDYLAKNDQYKVILHGISVGGYLGQRVVMGLQGTDLLYSKWADLSCFYETADFIAKAPASSPTFFMHSLADKVGNFNTIGKSLPSLARGSPVYKMVIPEHEQIKHVALFRNMGEDVYMSCITRFLLNNKFSVIRPEVLCEIAPDSEEVRIYHERTKPVLPASS
ncbi:hypothetical protein Anas_00672 [Armadillidium nasatum]|uniref:Transmembrane protein n=1 Tax=Armadillidium nasatum TaxID=96803 RepID=A0A5N5TKF7_9CRUS|nr:hypothetical protein Anas_00672 [Armadillidium nasatum]